MSQDLWELNLSSRGWCASLECFAKTRSVVNGVYWQQAATTSPKMPITTMKITNIIVIMQLLTITTTRAVAVGTRSNNSRAAVATITVAEVATITVA